MTECPRKYKNLGSESFGEQKYVTAEMLHQFCKNDAWLHYMVRQLQDDAPPIFRKRFSPVVLDEDNSYGCVLTTEGNVIFDNTTSKEILINFSKACQGVSLSDETNYCGEEMIDTEKSTVILTSFLANIEDETSVKKHVTMTPGTIESVDTTSTRDRCPWSQIDDDGNIIYDAMQCNEYWYVGYDKNKPYQTRPAWLYNNLVMDIPSVARAQSFTCKKTGYLTGVTLSLKRGSITSVGGLVVTIRKMVERTDKNGANSLGYFPDHQYHPFLAYKVVNAASLSEPGAYTVVFENPVYIEDGEQYAVVVQAPLAHWTNCWHIGGWSTSCSPAGYDYGDAFLSEDNSYSWTKYGKTDETLSYHEGRNIPEDFLFQCHISTYTEGYNTGIDNAEYLYLKPIKSNRVISVTVAGTDDGDVSDDNVHLEYQVSNDGVNWYTTSATNPVTFEEHKHVTLVRAKMWTSNSSSTPKIEGMNIRLTTEVADDAYARTMFYYPRTNPMLGATSWNAFNAPYALTGDATCEVEVIPETTGTEHVKIVSVGHSFFYIYLLSDDTTLYRKMSNASTTEKLRQVLIDNPKILDIYAENHIYVAGFIGKNNTYSDEDGRKYKQIRLINSPASSILACTFYPMEYNTGDPDSYAYSEWIDYEVDYETDEVAFNDEVRGKFVTGDLVFSYRPVFAGGFHNEDMPVNLDVFTETFIVNQNHLDEGYLQLKAVPQDPMRSVVLWADTENETELYEDENYTVDYENKRINLFIDETTAVALNDEVTVKYVPVIEETSIALGYYMERTDPNSTCTITPNWIEYKT